MSTVKPVWTLLLVPLTAVVVFATYRGLMPDAAQDSAESTHEWSATTPVERSSTVATGSNARSDDSPEPGEFSTASASLSPAQQEVAAMSETFRNTTLLIAIRQSGYVCEHMLGADRGADDVAAWRVRCSGPVAYLVGVDAEGNMSVGPMTYGDGLNVPFRFAPQGGELPGPDSTRLDQLRQ